MHRSRPIAGSFLTPDSLAPCTYPQSLCICKQPWEIWNRWSWTLWNISPNLTVYRTMWGMSTHERFLSLLVRRCGASKSSLHSHLPSTSLPLIVSDGGLELLTEHSKVSGMVRMCSLCTHRPHGQEYGPYQTTNQFLRTICNRTFLSIVLPPVLFRMPSECHGMCIMNLPWNARIWSYDQKSNDSTD